MKTKQIVCKTFAFCTIVSIALAGNIGHVAESRETLFKKLN